MRATGLLAELTLSPFEAADAAAWPRPSPAPLPNRARLLQATTGASRCT